MEHNGIIITRLRIFKRIRIFMNISTKDPAVLFAEYYREYQSLDILYVVVYHVHSVDTFTFKITFSVSLEKSLLFPRMYAHFNILPMVRILNNACRFALLPYWYRSTNDRLTRCDFIGFESETMVVDFRESPPFSAQVERHNVARATTAIAFAICQN